jgi:hypothetical protein
MRCAPHCLIVCLALAGCGRIIDGQYLGDATIRLEAILPFDVGAPRHIAAGAVWLGYEGLIHPLVGIETSLLPINPGVGTRFTCDVLGAPPSSGDYVTTGDALMPVQMRLGRLIVLDDSNGDGRFALDDTGALVPPDCLLAVAPTQALLYLPAPPDAATAATAPWLRDWHNAVAGHQLVQLDGDVATPDVAARLVGATTLVQFAPLTLPVAW